ncbi:hypothetical protein MMC11_008450 [Xylographa trunciseda]|nr:hypothetical protein [Xylographa trunciseda]
MSKVMGDLTLRHLEARILISDWRYIAVAIDRDIIRASSTDDLDYVIDESEYDDPYDLQAGHFFRIANLHYGLRADLLVGLTSTLFRAFSKVTALWQAYFLQEPETKRKACSLQVDANMLINPMPPPLSCQPRLQPVEETPAQRTVKRPRLSESSDSAKIVNLHMTRMKPQLQDFLSPGQRQAVFTTLDTKDHLIVVLPTGGGKSLIYMLYALVNPAVTTVVVVPFVALLKSILQSCNTNGISAVEWSPDIGEYSMVFVGVENAISLAFLLYARRMQVKGSLGPIVFEEAHNIVEPI